MTKRGFTLAELLIALAILGVIATFTIPKVLNGQQDQRFNSVAKETISMLSQAYTLYKMDQEVDAATIAWDLTPYMNYVAVDSTTVIDYYPGGLSNTCDSGSYRCIKLHNGAILMLVTTLNFAGTGPLNAVQFIIDPDGRYSGSTTGTGKSLWGYLYYDGKVRDYGNIEPNTLSGAWTYNPCPACIPTWFSWDN